MTLGGCLNLSNSHKRQRQEKDKKCVLFTIFLVQRLTTSDNPISLWFLVNMEFKFWLEVENLKYYRKQDKIQNTSYQRHEVVKCRFFHILVPFNEHVQRSPLQFIKQKYKNKASGISVTNFCLCLDKKMTVTKFTSSTRNHTPLYVHQREIISFPHVRKLQEVQETE